MRSSYTGKENVFYYVTSGNGRVNGIVWRGYLTAGTNPGASSDTNSGDSTSNSNSADNGGTNTGATGNNDSSTNSNSGTNSGLIGSSTTTYSTNSNQFNTKDVTAFNKQIIQLFPGLLEDQKLDDVASQDLELSDKYNYGDQETLLDKYIVQTYGGHPYGLLEDWNAVTVPNVSLVKKQVADPLSTIDYSDIEKYKGYHIGVASEAKSSSSNSSKITKIDYYIYILPANPKITLAG
ncbi:D-alanyl-D-alanine carboxypeptidase [Lentilactobacillus hilgardii]|uniref:D-alanyl-D-alanine carboxypeptidase n=1 Tax=Lentilactobacillus hilgardii TaxID=1588 RepID=UPI003FA612C8